MNRAIILLLPVAISICPNAMASGPIGHFLVAQKTIENIRNGRAEESAEIRRLLDDPECRRAYSGGSVAPDICEEMSHYGDTAALANRLLVAARERARAAAAARDDQAFQRARREIAFAYGWQSHCASDLDIHPVVNARAGDTFRYLDKGGKLAHGLYESQLTAYLQKTIGKKPYDIAIPFAFLSEVTGISETQLRRAEVVVKGKAAGELVAASKVTLSLDQLRALWGSAVLQSLRDAEAFHRNPASLENWDLDCGRISTADFDALRKEAMALNGGTLPKEWGRSYLTWWAQVKGLSPAARRVLLQTLVSGNVSTGQWVLEDKQLLNSMRKPSTSGRSDDGGDLSWVETFGYKVSASSVIFTKKITQDRPLTGESGSETSAPPKHFSATLARQAEWTPAPESLSQGGTFTLKVTLGIKGSGAESDQPLSGFYKDYGMRSGSLNCRLTIKSVTGRTRKLADITIMGGEPPKSTTIIVPRLAMEGDVLVFSVNLQAGNDADTQFGERGEKSSYQAIYTYRFQPNEAK